MVREGPLVTLLSRPYQKILTKTCCWYFAKLAGPFMIHMILLSVILTP